MLTNGVRGNISLLLHQEKPTITINIGGLFFLIQDCYTGYVAKSRLSCETAKSVIVYAAPFLAGMIGSLFVLSLDTKLLLTPSMSDC